MSHHKDETINEENPPPKVVPQIITVTNISAKFPYLKKGEYDIWAMKMQNFISSSDLLCWNIVLKGNSAKSITTDKYVFEIDTKGYSSSSSTLSNAAFVSTAGTSQGNLFYQESGNVGYTTSPGSSSSKGSSKSKCSVVDGVIYSFFTNHEIDQHLVYEDLDQMNKEDFEEYDLKHQMAMLSIKVHRFEKKHGRKIKFNGRENASIDWDKQTEGGNTEPRSLENFSIIARIKIKSDADSEGEVVSAGTIVAAVGEPIYNRFASVDHMKAVPPLLTGNYMPPSNIPNIDESQMVYGKKATDLSEIKTNDDSISKFNDSVLFYFSDRFAKNAERKGILGRRPTGKPVNPNKQNPVSAGPPNPVSAGQQNTVSAGNKDKLEDFEDFDGGKVTFRRISQICDQTHRVLFTENKSLVLSKDFPLPDPSMVILSIPRKHNLYTFSLNALAPKGPLTCLIAKALQTESTLWHRRLGYVNFKNMNKLGIRRDYSNARTPQQNEVDEKKNQTLIEAARTMLADSLLPTIFWTEAVATACYVLNRVLVTKPHDKTPYKLLTGDKPSISYLKPFGCHVTILNTSDPLGKFNKKSDEGYIVGVSSTNLTVGSQGATPSNTCSQEDDSDSDDEPDVLIIQSTPTPVVPIVDEATTQNDGKEEADCLGLAFPSLNLILGVGSAFIGSSVSAGSTPPVSACSTPQISLCASPIFADRHSISTGKCHGSAGRPVSASRPTGSAGRSVSAGRPTGFAGRSVSVGRPVSASSLIGSASIPVSVGRPSGSAARTPVLAACSFEKFTTSTSFERFPRASNVELSDIHNGLKIFDCPKSGIFTSSSYDEEFSGTKWILKNKRDAKGIVCRNKAWLMAQGHRQEEGIDYTNVFAPVARIEAIRLFLAFASFIGFMVYQMDVKSAFLYGKIAKEVYVTQPRGFEDLDHPKKVYRVVKALKDWCEEFETLMQNEFEMSSMGPFTFFLGLQIDQRPDGIFIYQEKYVADILKKFDLDNSKLASTPFEPQRIRGKNVPDEPIIVHLYKSMIGCLMYLPATRPDIMFAVCAAARHQVIPKTSNLLFVKRIFNDYAGANGDKKSTTSGCQFLGRRLISWQCKKQTIVATSSCEAEYVAAASCCSQAPFY
nr:putative ribonuclease H-like domain-containing protein [Tanacetum cinerariifolium]